MKRIKIYVYGAGQKYNEFLSYTAAYAERIEIMGIVTTERQSINFLDGYPCITASEMKLEKVDFIVIAVEKWKEILSYLKMLGVKSDKIILSNVFALPYFDLDGYLELKRERITILSNNCLGAHVYRELGLEYNSPSIDIGCWGEYYLSFIENYKYYLTKDMEIYTQKSMYSESPYQWDYFTPKGIIDNKIIWGFNHSIDVEKTIQKWNERKERCNLNNVAVLMVLYTDEEAKHFERLDCKKKLGVYYNDLNLKSVIYCSEWNDMENRRKHLHNWAAYAIAYMCSTYGAKGKIDWIKFLTDKEDYIRF